MTEEAPTPTTIPYDDEFDLLSGTPGQTSLPEHREGWLLVRIHVPELNVSKCLQFPSERLVWDVKQQVLASLPKDLKESFNYGLFCPPSNGRAGKFLDEERRLGDYPFNGPVGYLELKYKKRVYKMLNLDEKQLKGLHTRANFRRFLEYVNNGQVEKVSKMCTKGLDPNFHCPETNETPLTLAIGVKRPNKLLITLVNGGAILDYRAKDGATALHKAVEKNSLEAVTTLLELGASPNYRDSRGITPVYLSVTKKADPKICESLLHDHASLGVQDSQGWQEIHQACRNGLVHHLEHLLFYGADMNGRNASGNTPLHVCAVNNQEACARMLLFRGAQRGSLNYANQTPYQVAVIAGNLELAEIIQNYKPEDIVPFRGPPRYNPRRRSALGWPSGGSSAMILSGPGAVAAAIMNGGMGGGMHTLTRISIGPPSPCPSDHPFSSASSSLSEGSSSHRSHEDDISIVTDKSIGDTSDIISDSSGVGTSSDSTACSIGHPNTTVVCMIPYTQNYPGHLAIQPGDVIEVFGSTDCGLLEGQVRGSNRTGLFPMQYVQEVNFRQKNITNVSTATMPNNNHQMQHQQQPQIDYNAINNNVNHMNNNSIQNSAGMSQYNSNTAPRMKRVYANEPRTVTLHRAKRGFGFVLRGAKATSPLMQLKPSERCPALQYLDDVDPSGVADLAGLKRGDYLLAINNNDVRAASHEQVVDLIRKSGALVTLTVLSPNYGDANGNMFHQQPNLMANGSGNGSGGGVYAAPLNGRNCSTLPRRIMQQQQYHNGGKMPAPAPPQRDPKTTLSVGRARAKSMVAGLEFDNNGHLRDNDDMDNQNENSVGGDLNTAKSSSAESIGQGTLTGSLASSQAGTPVPLRTASIKARPTSSRITAAELEELFQRQQGENADKCSSYMMTTSTFQSGGDSNSVTPHVSPQKGAPLVYSSVADMKRKNKSKNNCGTLRGKPCNIPSVGSISELKRTFHSTPDLTATAIWQQQHQPLNDHQSGYKSGCDDDVNRGLSRSMQRLNLPAPTHPPPPAPLAEQHGHLVKVEVSSEYESTANLQKMLHAKVAPNSEVMSSFKPASNAKLYASPQDIRSVAFRSKMDKTRRKTTQVTSASMLGTESKSTGVYAQPQQPPMNNNSSMVTQGAADAQLLPPPPPPPLPASQQPAPPIPEPDYSLSESEEPEEAQPNGRIDKSNVTSQTNSGIYKSNNVNGVTQVENGAYAKPMVEKKSSEMTQSTNGNSGANNAMLHSFSVFEIQKMRNNLKSSKSYPNDLVNPQEKEADCAEDNENGQSGNVHSVEKEKAPSKEDIPLPTTKSVENNNPIVVQSVAKKSVNFAMDEPEKNKPAPTAIVSPPKTVGKKEPDTEYYDDDDEVALDDIDDLDGEDGGNSPSPPPMEFQRHNSMTRKQATALAMQRAMQLQQQRVTMSLTQLPPPMEQPCLVESDLEVIGKPLLATNVKQHYHIHSQIAHSHPIRGNTSGPLMKTPTYMTNRQHNNPIQVQFHQPTATVHSPDQIVLAPPPQFSDAVDEVDAVDCISKLDGYSQKQQQQYHIHQQQQQQPQHMHRGPMAQNVRIVGAVPKTHRF